MVRRFKPSISTIIKSFANYGYQHQEVAIPQPKTETKQKPNWKTPLKICLWLIFIVVLLIISLQFLKPQIGDRYLCTDITRTQYKEAKGTIRDLIAGKTPPTNLNEILFGQVVGSNNPQLDPMDLRRDSLEFYEVRPHSCDRCAFKIYELLRKAYRSVLEDNNTGARNYLRDADIYWLFHSECWGK